MNVVLDASVVAKWFFEEEQTKIAINLLEQHKTEKLKINEPMLLFFEIGNISINKLRENSNSQTDYNQNLSDLIKTQINFIEPNETTLQLTFKLAQKYKITFYDATYVALAQTLDCQFITADKKLADMTKNLNFVKPLPQTLTAW